MVELPVVNLVASVTMPILKLLFPAVFRGIVRSSAEKRLEERARGCKMPDLGGVETPYCYNSHRSMYIGHDKRMAQDRSIGTLWVHIERALVPGADFDVVRRAKKSLRSIWSCSNWGVEYSKCDAYCKVHYEGEDELTKTVHDTLQPTWDEVFRFNVQRKTSRASVLLYDHDVTSRDDMLGHVQIPSVEELLNMAQHQNNGRMKWRGVLPIKESDQLHGGDPMSAPAGRTKQMRDKATPVLYCACGFIPSKNDETPKDWRSSATTTISNYVSLQYVHQNKPQAPQALDDGATPRPAARSKNRSQTKASTTFQDSLLKVEIQYAVRDYLMKFVSMFHHPCSLGRARQCSSLVRYCSPIVL